MKYLLIPFIACSLLAGCGGGGSNCDKLAKKLCEGKDAATCAKVKTWLDGELTGPDHKKLSESEASEGCKMILDDKDALAAYQKQAADKAK
ncbi:MAG: hypothetical protein ACM31C_07455 [Acidobacteriota bacterium]